MDNVIQQLKDNEKPFGLMSDEMQAKMRHIGKHGCERFFARGNGMWGEIDMTSRVFLHDTTYRLRPDYADVPEIVECEIVTVNGILGCNYGFGDRPQGPKTCLSDCPSMPDFIGFKYESGMVRSDTIAYLPRDNYEGIHHRTEIKGLISGEFTVLHATHVLFRRSK